MWGSQNSIHLLIKYQDARLTGDGSRPAIRETLMILGSAHTPYQYHQRPLDLLLWELSSVVPMQRFGYYNRCRRIARIRYHYFLPPFYSAVLRDLNTKKPRIDPFSPPHRTLLEKVYYWVVRNHKPIVITTLLITLVFSWGATIA